MAARDRRAKLIGVVGGVRDVTELMTDISRLDPIGQAALVACAACRYDIACWFVCRQVPRAGCRPRPMTPDDMIK